MNRARFPVALLLMCVLGAARADDDAHQWLVKMDRAARTLNYEGVFVYQHKNLLDTMRIVHSVADGLRERLVSLNGAPREIVRDGSEVRFYLPDRNTVVAESRAADHKRFPAILPERLSDLDQNYVIELGKRGRVAGHDAQLVRIVPKDRYRYGYELWADEATGLLLKSDLVSREGAVFERFMFTELNARSQIAPGDLEPSFRDKNPEWRHRESEVASDAAPQWQAQLPPGFKFTAHLAGHMPGHKQPVDHLIYSDGLATISVFVERTDAAKSPAAEAANHMGAVHAYRKIVDNHRLTVVGEAPAATVDLIGRTLKPLQ